jgi:hypothetical protein
MKQSISEQELAICRQMGVSPADYLKTKQQEAEAALNRDGLRPTGSLSDRSLSSTPCYSRKNNAIPACYE